MNTLIISGDEGIAILLLRYLSLHGSEAHIVSVWPSSGASGFSRYCKSYQSYLVPKSLQQQEEFIRFINEYCDQKEIKTILAAGLLGTFILSKIKDRLDSPIKYLMPTADQIRDLHNKWLFYNLLNDIGIPTPKTMLLENVDQANLSAIDFPVILKPLTLENGKGVQRVTSSQEVEAYLSQSQPSNRSPLLIQEYIPGFDVVFGFVAKDGEIVAWTMLQRMPDFIKFFRDDTLLEFGRRIVAACNYTGAANFDIRVDSRTNHIYFLEFNPRLWSSTSSSIYYGVDFIKVGILLAQGKDLPKDLKTSVHETQEIPYHQPPKFLKGMLLGKYKFQGIKKDMAWQAVFDPLPSLQEILWSRFGLKKPHNSTLLEEID